MRGPALQPGVVLIEQLYRGDQSFVVKDPVTHKYFRFRPTEAAVIRSLDGSRSIEEIVLALAEQGLAISAGAIEAFARTLSRMGLLERSLAERTSFQLERLRTERRQQRSLFRGEWLRMRWAFPDSNDFFNRSMPFLRWCFTPGFVVASVALFVVYAWILTTQWGEFSAAVGANFSAAALTGGGIGILVVTFLVLTLIHELGHGFACKYYGGDVHELGFMILYFSPAFYCNVNDAWSFQTLRSRLWVTAAGAWIELVFSAMAALVWVTARPDTLLAQFALAAMMIGGFMTIITNANPLMPLDGYFALSDYLEIPNLRQRAAAHVTWWTRRHLLRLDLPEPDVAPKEQRLFLIYGALSMLYGGLFISWVALMVLGGASRTFGFLGGMLVILAIIALLWTKLVTLWRGTVLAIRAQTGGDRWRSWRRRAPLVLLIALLVTAIIPWNLQSEGAFVVAPVRSLAVVAVDSGVVAEVYPGPGAQIEAGTPVVRILDLGLVRSLARESRAADSLASLEQLARAMAHAGAEAQLTAERRAAEAGAAVTRSRMAQEVIRTRISGTVVTPHPEWLLGRWVGAGDTLMLVQDLTTLEARIVLASSGSTRVEPGQRVRLISYQELNTPLEGVVTRVASAGITHGFGAVEVGVALPAGTRLRAGASGEAKVRWRRSTMLGAIWWSIRSRIRNDLLL